MSSLCVPNMQIVRVASLHGGVLGLHPAANLASVCVIYVSDQV
jgi:hypothetical protein